MKKTIRSGNSGKLTLNTETVANLALKTSIKAGVAASKNSCAVGRPTHCNEQ